MVEDRKFAITNSFLSIQGHGEGETEAVPEARAVPAAAQGARLAAQAARPSPAWGTAGPPAGRPAATAAHQ